ncbi:hypothetical protein HN51_001834 [Arachis hypogaea]
MWLSGAKASGKELIPGSLAPEEIKEMKDEEELDILAEEDQSRCALCGEGFNEFYNHEIDEWTYKGVTYLKASVGTTLATMDRHKLGPIVHSKCRFDSNSTMSSTNMYLLFIYDLSYIILAYYYYYLLFFLVSFVYAGNLPRE